jgi:Na+/H+ antiporter NhaD/arsenite permease-like protein
LQSVEWDTLLFIAALFVMIEGLGELGLWRAIAHVRSQTVWTQSPLAN